VRTFPLDGARLFSARTIIASDSILAIHARLKIGFERVRALVTVIDAAAGRVGQREGALNFLVEVAEGDTLGEGITLGEEGATIPFRAKERSGRGWVWMFQEAFSFGWTIRRQYPTCFIPTFVRIRRWASSRLRVTLGTPRITCAWQLVVP
jgi:hypothetical protein